MDSRIRITVSGPGETFGRTMHWLKAKLEEDGIEVEVIDEYPDPADMDPDCYVAQRNRDLTHGVVLVADHQPWGG